MRLEEMFPLIDNTSILKQNEDPIGKKSAVHFHTIISDVMLIKHVENMTVAKFSHYRVCKIRIKHKCHDILSKNMVMYLCIRCHIK